MDCIILDIDGTLWDTTPIVTHAWNDVLKERTDIAWRPSPDNLKKLFGRPLTEIAALAFPELSTEEQTKLIDLLCEAEQATLRKTPGIPFENMVETVAKLSEHYKVCIVSNCEAGYIELMMSSFGLEKYITDFECPGYTGLSKGENCKLIMERNQFQSAVYVGDTQGDRDAARFAGIPFVYCEYGFGEVDSYEYSIKRLPELLELFA